MFFLVCFQFGFKFRKEKLKKKNTNDLIFYIRCITYILIFSLNVSPFFLLRILLHEIKNILKNILKTSFKHDKENTFTRCNKNNLSTKKIYFYKICLKCNCTVIINSFYKIY